MRDDAEEGLRRLVRALLEGIDEQLATPPRPDDRQSVLIARSAEEEEEAIDPADDPAETAREEGHARVDGPDGEAAEDHAMNAEPAEEQPRHEDGLLGRS